MAVQGDQRLLRLLMLASAQFYGSVPSAPLHWDKAANGQWRKYPSLCAGLPHFATGFMRNWGRDTFISLRGCLLLTGRFQEAKSTILTYASVVRHGLVPNLLDSCNKPRYNARDATWFFLQAIQDYCTLAPNGTSILSERVELKWPIEQWAPPKVVNSVKSSTLIDIVHVILQCHAFGIDFREVGAGPQLDEHMKDSGFHVKVSFDKDTGIIYGGNNDNCGTWMDKMGSSFNAGNKGTPATPRDGAAIEIVCLLKSTLRWVLSLGSYFPDKVLLNDGSFLTYHDWNRRLEANFDQLYYKREGYYRDTIGATRSHQNEQLRPNQCIGMAVAPELFDHDHALIALSNCEKHLVGPFGMKTLAQWNDSGEYRADYDNSNDSCDWNIAQGFNYHQGPEWVWPMGYYLRAKLQFKERKMSARDCMVSCMRVLRHHREHLLKDPWRSLPELTNDNGNLCRDSCPVRF